MGAEKSSSGTVRSWLIWLAQTIGLLIVIWGAFFLLNRYLIDNTRVSGTSMQPTFEDNDRAIAWRHSKVKTGDVVVIDAPDQPGAFYIKRVIATPQQTVVAKDNQIYVNGKKLQQDYLKPGSKLVDDGTAGVYGTKYTDTDDFSLRTLAKSSYYRKLYTPQQLQQLQATNQVPKGSYFVMGDHRSVSKDSRYIGFIPRDKIEGVVKVRYWPLTSWKIFN
ncbi:signal peptidase I [Lactobacillus sp. DCY120]|uniref:Signal peptidase I n=1 Tax=Bombilactobacillus apium TaxID=2675299 RepID=A0A850R0F1_9LACO|nr:signal peptidase I [Bombilactobacillus apium]NVY95830.1 signal peptidase I [Bombilactobacillus apium]